jgi:hypothetical protein
MNCQNFEFVKRDENAPNVPQVWPFRDIGLNTREFKNGKSLPKNLNGFRRIWFNI